MKNLFSFSISMSFMLFSTVLYSQDEIQKVQQEWGKDKKELVGLAMDLSPADSVKFWPLYAKYEKEKQKLGRDRILTLTEYNDNFENLTNAKADAIINKLFINEAALAKLQQQYYTSIKTKLNSLQAAKFLQIETYFTTAIRAAIQDELPFIGELESLKKQ